MEGYMLRPVLQDLQCGKAEKGGDMSKRTLLAVAVSAVTAAGLSANAALAGEITGNGKVIAAPFEHAQSECAFSGLDDPDADVFTHTQSWGQLVAMFGPMGGVPGVACNPTRSGG
jgi:hypothetical protein